MLRAVNRHHKVPYHQYGGRGTVFGNPYQHGTRDENCDDYQVYFESELLNSASEISRAVTELIAICKDREFVIGRVPEIEPASSRTESPEGVRIVNTARS